VDAVAARFVPYAGDAEARARVSPPPAWAAPRWDAPPWAAAPEPAAPGGLGDAAPLSPADGFAGADGGFPGADGGFPGADGGFPGAAAEPAAAGGSAAALGDAGDGEPAASAVPAAAMESLAAAFAAAAGVNGVGRALQSARELKAVDYVGWPVAWLADRVARRDPVRKIRLGALWSELREVSAGATGAQQADISNAITVLADQAGHGLPGPWQAGVRQAARSRTAEIPGALGTAIAASLPQENIVTPWWRAAAAWQGLLLGAAAVGLAWIVAIVILGGLGAAPHAALMLRDVGLLPWVALMVAAILLLGWLTANGCMALVIREADQERDQAQQRMRAGIAEVARQYVVGPVEGELLEFARFHDELTVARAAA
jgi:hypothetical protein